MTHVPEVGAEIPYQNTGTINQHEHVLERFGTILHNRFINWYWFLVPISGKCVMGIMTGLSLSVIMFDPLISQLTLALDCTFGLRDQCCIFYLKNVIFYILVT